jgi:hypothetical protein
VTCAGDASDTGGGGHCEPLLPTPMVVGYSQEDKARMAVGKLSSTLREVRAACWLMRACMKAAPATLRHGALVCLCDNQGAVANISKMQGSLEEVAEICHLMTEAASLDVQV